MPAGILTTIRECPNSGDDIAGIVHEVGSDVTNFKRGDRIVALHQLGAPGGSYAEYAVANDFAAFHIPKDMSFKEAATIPMIAYMASIGLFAMLRVASGPFAPLKEPRPLLIYGASSSVGAMAVRLAQLTNIHPVICVAGDGAPFVETLISREKGDTTVSYNGGPEALISGIKHALKGQKLEYAFDCISEKGSYINCAKVLDQKTGKITITLPPRKEEVPTSIEQTATMAASLWRNLAADPAHKHLGDLGMGKEGKWFGLVFSSLIGKMLAEKVLTPLQHKVFPAGLAGLEDALKTSRAGKANATAKMVVRVPETPGLS